MLGLFNLLRRPLAGQAYKVISGKSLSIHTHEARVPSNIWNAVVRRFVSRFRPRISLLLPSLILWWSGTPLELLVQSGRMLEHCLQAALSSSKWQQSKLAAALYAVVYASITSHSRNLDLNLSLTDKERDLATSRNSLKQYRVAHCLKASLS